MFSKYAKYIVKDFKEKQEWKRKLERWAKRKEMEKNVETVDKVVDKWIN